MSSVLPEFDDQVILLPNTQRNGSRQAPPKPASSLNGQQATPLAAPPQSAMGRDAVQELEGHPDEFMFGHTSSSTPSSRPPAQATQDSHSLGSQSEGSSVASGHRPAFQPGTVCVCMYVCIRQWPGRRCRLHSTLCCG